MLVHYKQIQRKRNRERETERYKRKREERAYLTEAFNDGELALYKPEHKPYRIFTDKVTLNNFEIPFWTEGNLPKEEIEKYTNKPVKFNWFEKFLLWIKEVFR